MTRFLLPRTLGVGSGEWGMGNGEWGVKRATFLPPHPTPHSPLPTPDFFISSRLILFKRFLNSRMFSFAVVDGARRADDVVGEIEVQIAVLDHLAQEGSQVSRIQLA